jgi:DNA-binding NarL/FixJ family response regulator
MTQAILKSDSSARSGAGDEEPGATISRHAALGSSFVVLASVIPVRPRWASSLTRAEVAVLSLVGRGMRTAEIAAARGSSVSTVVKQLGALKQKTGSQDRTRLTTLGRRYWSEKSIAYSPIPLVARSALEAAREEESSRRPLGLTEARDLWGAMLDGRCSFVDRTDLRGQRWIVLRENQATQGPLSERERTIVGLLLAGASNKLVGWELHLSPSTVSLRVRGTLRKLGVVDRAGLIELASVLRGVG